MLYKDTGKRLYGNQATKPTWMSDNDWAVQSGEYRPMTDRWSTSDYLRPKEWQTFDKTTNQPVGAGYAGTTYNTFQPDISRTEWNSNLTNAFGNSPLTTRTENGQLVATKTLDPTGVSGYGKWGEETGNTSPLSYNWILPKDALDFKFAQSNAPLNDAQRSFSFDRGGAYSNASVEASPTRFTSGAFKIPQRETSLGMRPNSGGISNYMTGERFSPSMGGSSDTYGRFRGYTPNLNRVTPEQYIPLGRSNTPNARFSTSMPTFSTDPKYDEKKKQWDDEFAQEQGFKNYQEYLNRK